MEVIKRNETWFPSLPLLSSKLSAYEKENSYRKMKQKTKQNQTTKILITVSNE